MYAIEHGDTKCKVDKNSFEIINDYSNARSILCNQRVDATVVFNGKHFFFFFFE